MGTIDTKRYQTDGFQDIGLAASRFVYHAVGRLASFSKRHSEALMKARTRRALRDLTKEQLLDIGKTRREALVEARRPFWD